MKIIYFNPETLTYIEFEENSITKENIKEQVQRIGALKNPIELKELYGKLDDDELDDLLILAQSKPLNVANMFFFKEEDKTEYYLTLHHIMEKVNYVGKNEDCSLVKIINTKFGILQASNLFLEKNMFKTNSI